MNILLKSLDLVHFKCFNVLHLDFHEGVNNIYGENAARPRPAFTTLLTWLLFDKDSAGHSRPDIKPHGAPAGTMPEVTAILRWTASRSSCARCSARSGEAARLVHRALCR